MGLAALLLNPIVLLILVIVGIAFLSVGIALIVYYGLVTAIVLFVLTALGIIVLAYLHAINLNEQPLFGILPFIMAVVGYVGERLSIFSIQPLWATKTSTATSLSGQSASIVFLIVLVVLLFAAVAIHHRRQ
jgi:uncharacterized RDD family membrane protein YckC